MSSLERTKGVPTTWGWQAVDLEFNFRCSWGLTPQVFSLQNEMRREATICVRIKWNHHEQSPVCLGSMLTPTAILFVLINKHLLSTYYMRHTSKHFTSVKSFDHQNNPMRWDPYCLMYVSASVLQNRWEKSKLWARGKTAPGPAGPVWACFVTTAPPPVQGCPYDSSSMEMLPWTDEYPDSCALVLVWSLWGPQNAGVQLSCLLETEDVGMTPRGRVINEGLRAPGLTSPSPQVSSCPCLSLPFCPVGTALPPYSNHHWQLLTHGDRAEVWRGRSEQFLRSWLCHPWCCKVQRSPLVQRLMLSASSLPFLLLLKKILWVPGKDHLLQKGFPDCSSLQWILPIKSDIRCDHQYQLFKCQDYLEAEVPKLSVHHITWKASWATDFWVSLQCFCFRFSMSKVGLKNLQF